MSVLVFRHVPYEDLGLIAPALSWAGLKYEYVDLAQQPGKQASLGGVRGLIFMGGPMSVNDELEFVARELDIIRQAAARGIAMLGVCLGAQLIAKAFGARVYPNPVKEIGWFPVRWTEEASGDALFRGLPDPAVVFHWHGETFDLPSGSVRLGYSAACRNQAFRLGGNIYGLQFHLEVTPAMIAGWLEEDQNQADLRELTSPVDPFQHAEELAKMGGTVFARWGTLASGRPPL